jgi:hypothetical protein
MNRELFMVFLPGISWTLFALGGTQIRADVPGWKGWRRFILPAVYAVACLIASIVWWKVALIAAGAVFAYLQGYGDRAPWWKKCLIGFAYGTISAPIGLSWWNLVTVLAFVLLFALSNWKYTRKTVVWKICEGFFGLFVGIELAFKLMGG